MTKQLLNASSDAMILMKSGERKYGILLEQPSRESYRFVSNQSLPGFLDSADSTLVETLSVQSIEAIDVDLK
jgi:hypothetical protein